MVGTVRASGILIAGTSSDAGKSLAVTGLCRVLARRGISVAPFKAQNMSNNSAVCADGSEIGRAQYLQAQAARVEPRSALNPVLLKPGSDRRSHIVLRGRPAGTLESGEYATGRAHLAAAAFAAYDELAAEHDLVICEGAGSPAEINLRAGDYVNLGLARAKGLPVTVVGDIDRGGVLAALFGTVGLLEDSDRALIDSFVINKFRGDPGILQPGLEELTRRTGVPVIGVLPWLHDVWLDGEDSLTAGAWHRSAGRDPLSDATSEPVRIAVVALPRTSNATDVDALAAEPGVEVLITADPGQLRGADLVVLPGSRATVGDLDWLRSRGLDRVIQDRAVRGAPVLGICGGYQMLAREITDEVESVRRSPADGAGAVDSVDVLTGTTPSNRPHCRQGLDLLPVTVQFSREKVLGRPAGAWAGHAVTAYEIHHGIASFDGTPEPFLDGCRAGSVWGTMWHGAFENDEFRRAWLRTVKPGWQPAAGAEAYAARRERMIDTLADAIEEHLDLPRLFAGTRIATRLG